VAEVIGGKKRDEIEAEKLIRKAKVRKSTRNMNKMKKNRLINT
jgi:hypothetical protein